MNDQQAKHGIILIIEILLRIVQKVCEVMHNFLHNLRAYTYVCMYMYLHIPIYWKSMLI